MHRMVYGEPPENVAGSIQRHSFADRSMPIESKLMFETILKRHKEVNPNFKYAL